MLNIEIIGRIQAIAEELRLDALVAEWALDLQRGNLSS